MTTKGFHVCKAGNAPTVGQVKSLIVIGDRIKSKKIEEGGQNYTITKVTPRESYSDSYGNAGFDIEITPTNGAPQSHVGTQRAFTPPMGDERSNRIERQHSQEMAIRYAALKGLSTLDTDALRTLIDWFHRDVSRMPAPPEAKSEEAPEPPEGDEAF